MVTAAAGMMARARVTRTAARSARQITDDAAFLAASTWEGPMGCCTVPLAEFARVLRRHALMDEMMEAQGVDLLAAVRAGEAFVPGAGELPRLQG
jgi:hypothetical protein